MTDYKALKEAFHADNPGGPVLEVLGVSFICAVSGFVQSSGVYLNNQRLAICCMLRWLLWARDGSLWRVNTPPQFSLCS